MLGFKLLTYDAVRNELGRHILGTDSVALALITSFLAGLICYALVCGSGTGPGAGRKSLRRHGEVAAPLSSPAVSRSVSAASAVTPLTMSASCDAARSERPSHVSIPGGQLTYPQHWVDVPLDIS